MIIGFNSESLLLSFSLICAVKLSEYRGAIELDFYGHPYEALRILVIDRCFLVLNMRRFRTYPKPPKLLSHRVDALSLTLSFSSLISSQVFCC